jgi:hypothetical protein
MAFLTIVGALAYRMELTRRDVERWEAYKKEARSRGEDLGIKAWLPLEIPDVENFAAHPWIAGMCASENSPEAKVMWDWKYWQYDVLEDCEGPNEGKSWFEGKPDKVRSVLGRGLAHAADFEAIHDAAARPSCRLPFGTEPDQEKLSEILGRLGDTGNALSLRAEAALLGNDEGTAVEDLEALLRIGDHLRSQHFLVANLLGHRLKASAVSIVEIGLSRRSFSPDAKRRLKRALRTPAIPEEASRMMRLERGIVLEEMGKALGRPESMGGAGFRERFVDPPPRQAARFKLSFCRTLDLVLEKPETRSTWEAFDDIVTTAARDGISTELSRGSIGIYGGIFPMLFQHADRVDGVCDRLGD